MLRSLIDDVQREFRIGNMVTRLVIVNIAAFVVINLTKLGFTVAGAGNVHPMYYEIRKWLTLSSDHWWDLTHPWVFLTAIFLHEGFFHLLWNMLALYWFGRIVGDLVGNHRILPVYLVTGFFAGLVFVGSAQFMPFGRTGEVYALGASGAVMGIVLAAATIAPDYRMHLLLLGEVRLKYIAAAMLFLDLIGVGGMANAGGHVAHLGGAFAGYLYVIGLRRGSDPGIGINRFFEWLGGLAGGERRKRRKGLRLVYRGELRESGRPGPAVFRADQERLDAILDKIKNRGIDSLSPEERSFLEDRSKS
jgi:membrane associated rhomboid family serine protease